MRSQSDFAVEQADWDRDQEVLSSIRRAVFVVEQGVPEALEWDGIDPECTHVLARCAQGSPIGTGRLLPDAHIGRMAVLEPWRGRGVGSALLTALIEIAHRRAFRRVALNAQTYAVGFYERHGFAAVGEEFMDAGIPHVAMVKDLHAG